MGSPLGAGLAGGSQPVGRRGSSFAESDSVNELLRYYPDFEITTKPESLAWHFKNINTGKEFDFDRMDFKDKNSEFKGKIDQKHSPSGVGGLKL